MLRKFLHFIIVMTILLMMLPLQRVFRAPAFEINSSSAPYPPNMILPPQKLFPCDPNQKDLTLLGDGSQIDPISGSYRGWQSFVTRSDFNNNLIPELIDTGRNELLMWKIRDKSDAESNTCKTSYKAFESHETYIIIQTNSNVNPKSWDIYYWVGKSSSEANVETAATKVIELASKFHSAIKVHREAEGQESDSFKTLFRNQRVDSFAFNDGNSLAVERAFFIEEENDLDLREVEPSLDYVEETNEKCLVFVSNKIYGFCGRSTSGLQRKAAQRLTKFIQIRKGLVEDDVKTFFDAEPEPKLETDRKETFMQLLTKDEHKRSSELRIAVVPYQFTPKEKRVILGQTMIVHDEEFFNNIETTKIYEYRGRIREESVPPVLVPLTGLDAKVCYLIDSHSNAGLFVLMGRDATIELRKESGRKAEQYLKEHEYSYATPINFFDQLDVSSEVMSIQEIMSEALNSQNKEQTPVVHENQVEIRDHLYSNIDNLDLPNNFIVVDRVHQVFGEVYPNERGDPFLVWRTRDSTKSDKFTTDYNALKSDQTYVIMDVPPESDAIDAQKWNVYYWRGKQSPDDEAAKVARHAFHVDKKIHSIMKLRREAEGHESPAFKALFGGGERNIVENDTQDFNAHRVFVFDKENNLKEYPVDESSITLDFTDEELIRKCLVYNLDEIHSFCGLEVPLSEKGAALELHQILATKRNVKEKIKHLMFFDMDALPLARDDLKEYIRKTSQTVVHKPLKFTPKEIRRIFHQSDRFTDGTEKFCITVGRFFQTKSGALETDTEPLQCPNDRTIESLNDKDCYIIDSRSNAGMYIWIGRRSSDELREYAVYTSELFLGALNYSYETPIIFVHQDDIPSHVQTVEEIVHVFNPVDDQ